MDHARFDRDISFGGLDVAAVRIVLVVLVLLFLLFFIFLVLAGIGDEHLAPWRPGSQASLPASRASLAGFLRDGVVNHCAAVGVFRRAPVRVREAAAEPPATAGRTANRWAGDSVTVGVRFANRRQVVEDPDRPAHRADDQVVVLHLQIVNGHGRQVELERLPVGAVVGRVRRRPLGAERRAGPSSLGSARTACR